MSLDIVKIVEEKIRQNQESLLKFGQSYWNKIAQFQINFNGKSWKFIRAYDNGGGKNMEKCEMCGHFPCRYMFIIQDPNSGATLKVGSECIVNSFADINAKELVKQYGTKIARKVSIMDLNKDFIIQIETWMENNTSSFNNDYNAGFYTVKNALGKLYSGKILEKQLKDRVVSIISKNKTAEEKQAELEAKEKQNKLITQAKDIYNSSQVLSKWDEEFLEDVLPLSVRSKLSVKQMEILQRIVAEYSTPKVRNEYKLGNCLKCGPKSVMKIDNGIYRCKTCGQVEEIKPPEVAPSPITSIEEEMKAEVEAELKAEAEAEPTPEPEPEPSVPAGVQVVAKTKNPMYY